MKALLLLLVATSAQAGYSCVELGDKTERRWFQEEPCGPGYVNKPLPLPPLIREAPRLPDGAGFDVAGSERQIIGFDHRGRTVGVWVPRGTAVPFVSSDVVRVTRGRR